MDGAALTPPAPAGPLADPPPFQFGAVRFEAYLRPDGGYVWRSTCGRLACGRAADRYVVKLDGDLVGEDRSLIQVMGLGVAALGLPGLAPALQRKLRRAG